MENTNSQTTSSPMPQAIGSVLNSVLTAKPSSPRSEIGLSQNVPATRTGKRPSETVLDGLRNLARKMEAGISPPDQDLQALLLQHFGSSRLTIKERVKHLYLADGGYDCVPDGYDVGLDRLDDCELAIFNAIEFFNQKADRNFVAKHVAMLRVSLARRNESEDDIALLIGVYADILDGYPKDVVSSVTISWITHRKWFPLAAELRDACDRAVSLRRGLMKAIEECRNPLLTQTRQHRLEQDERLGTHWKMLAKKDWLPQHYQWALDDAREILASARANPSILRVELWEAEVAKMEAELAAANGDAMPKTAEGATHAAGNKEGQPVSP